MSTKIERTPQKPHFNVDDYIGKKVHSLTAIGLAERKPSDKEWKLRCLCECGRETYITPSQFRRGVVKSCGCKRATVCTKQKGHSKHPLYHVWLQMMYRCYKKTSKAYGRYGGRGISVCEEWHDFESFVRWSDSVGGRPDGYTLDRINNNGDYNPYNCRWVPMKIQNINKSDNIVIGYSGKSQTLSEWANQLGIKWVTLHNRYVRGWSIERMLTEPVNKKSGEAGA